MMTVDEKGEEVFHELVYLNLSITFYDVFGSILPFSDVYQSIFTPDVFESLLRSDVHKHVVCYLVMLMNCNH
jgi:hypothetical protein